MSSRRWAAVTMAYNEGPRLSLWLRHYGQAVGASNLTVLDDGSNDGSPETVQAFGANLLRLPRRPFSDLRRARLISQWLNGLLMVYDGVIYTDTDEILLPDPAHFSSLGDYLQELSADRATAIGLNVHQLADESPLDWQRPVLAQRSHVRFASSMCKTLVWRRPMTWSEGFHASRPGPLPEPLLAGPTQALLYLFHLKYADSLNLFQRLSMTRNMAWDDDNLRRDLGAHQRISDEAMQRRIDQVQAQAKQLVANSPKEPADFDFTSLLQQAWTTSSASADAMQGLRSNVLGPLCRLPERFLSAF